MQKEIKTTVPPVYITDLEKLAKRAREVSGAENTEVSFEFIIASLFPTSWEKIQSDLSHQYSLGYIQGWKDKTEEIREGSFHFGESDCYCE